MKQTPREYQSLAHKMVFESWDNGYKKPLLVMPTGSGKTTTAAMIIEKFIKDGKKVLFIAHRRELVEQAYSRFAIHGMDSGLILPGYHPNGHKLIIASVQTLIRREVPDVDLIVVDESHHSLSKSFLRILDEHVAKGERILGLTATPYRLDGKPLGFIFDDLVMPTTIKDLIDGGYLVQPRYFGAQREDLEGVKKVAGEYDSKEMFARYNKKTLYDNIIDQYVNFGGGKALVFCINVEHSMATRDAFADAGFKVAHVDGDTGIVERMATLRAFRQGSVEILCNCNLFTEGFDLPAIDTVIINRTTASLCLYTQMVGRGLRPSPGKEHGIIIDMGNNIYKHGFVEDERDFDLHAIKKKKNEGIYPIKTCPKCFSNVPAGCTVCPICKHVFPIKEMELIAAPFEEIKASPAGRKEKLPQHLRKKWSEMIREELEEVAKIRGYKKGWVFMQLKHRKGMVYA